MTSSCSINFVVNLKGEVVILIDHQSIPYFIVHISVKIGFKNRVGGVKINTHRHEFLEDYIYRIYLTMQQ